MVKECSINEIDTYLHRNAEQILNSEYYKTKVMAQKFIQQQSIPSIYEIKVYTSNFTIFIMVFRKNLELFSKMLSQIRKIVALQKQMWS